MGALAGLFEEHQIGIDACNTGGSRRLHSVRETEYAQHVSGHACWAIILRWQRCHHWERRSSWPAHLVRQQRALAKEGMLPEFAHDAQLAASVVAGIVA